MPDFKPGLTVEVFVGTTEQMWPIQVWELEEHAIGWLYDEGGQKVKTRHLHRAELKIGEELVLVIPKPYLSPVEVEREKLVEDVVVNSNLFKTGEGRFIRFDEE